MINFESFWKKIINNPFLYFPIYFLLLIFECIYKIILSIRNFLYDKNINVKKSDIFIISVGNITVGGTGKTLFVIYLLELLNKNKITSAVLTRGYKKKEKDNNIIISDGKNILTNVDLSGDEPFMIAESMASNPVLAGKDRLKISQIAKEKFNIKIGILDDGFQHRKIFRNINIVLIDASNPFGNNHVFPAGILREPIKNLKRADIIILTKTEFNKSLNDLIKIIKKYNNKALMFQSEIKTVCFFNNKNYKFDIDIIKAKKILVISSIGNPDFFYKQIKLLDPIEIFRIDFKDHYDYKICDINYIEKECKKNSIDYIVTTYKDMVKLRKFEFKINIIYLKIEIKLSLQDEEEILRQVYV